MTKMRTRDEIEQKIIDNVDTVVDAVVATDLPDSETLTAIHFTLAQLTAQLGGLITVALDIRDLLAAQAGGEGGDEN